MVNGDTSNGGISELRDGAGQRATVSVQKSLEIRLLSGLVTLLSYIRFPSLWDRIVAFMEAPIF